MFEGKSTLIWHQAEEYLLTMQPTVLSEAFLPVIALGVKNAMGCFSLSTPSLPKSCSSSAKHLQFTLGVIYKLIQCQNKDMTL